MPVTVFDLDTGADVLMTLSTDTDQDAARELAGEVGGLPLALAQAGSMVRATGLTLAAYRDLYRERSTDLLQHGNLSDYPHSVATTWQLRWHRRGVRSGRSVMISSLVTPSATMVTTVAAGMRSPRMQGAPHIMSVRAPTRSWAPAPPVTAWSPVAERLPGRGHGDWRERGCGQRVVPLRLPGLRGDDRLHRDVVG
jgi:hypothetical protein